MSFRIGKKKTDEGLVATRRWAFEHPGSIWGGSIESYKDVRGQEVISRRGHFGGPGRAHEGHVGRPQARHRVLGMGRVGGAGGICGRDLLALFLEPFGREIGKINEIRNKRSSV